jgi:trehalose 6-phosphate synthase/phosphatase
MRRLLLVSNRLPVTAKTEHGQLVVARSAGGLATGLRGPHEDSGGLWLGWPGDVARLSHAQRGELETRLAGLRAVPIYLTTGEVDRYYESFANGVLWPLFHYLLDRVPLDVKHWSTYQHVNERFADLVVQNYKPGDMIWVQDYQLMLVPGMVRKRLPDARIGFFLHIPFPSSEVFRILPHREEILEGLLGADLIGFHTIAYMRHFASSLLRLLGIEADVDLVRHEGRQIKIGSFPMGIDAAAFAALSDDEATVADAQRYREEGRGRRILLGIDRLDYTKGIPRRLMAFDRLLEREPSLRGKIRLVQVAVPSRTKVEAYQEFRRHVDEMVGRINGAYATPDWSPIHYIYRSLSERQVTALYRAADVMLVTPLRDGMNLVAKEFCAARTDEDGVLVLSEFAGAASEMGEALHVNPYDADNVAGAIKQALSMSEAERRSRMRALRHRVFAYDVHVWANSFIAQLDRAASEEEGRAHGVTQPQTIEQMLAEVQAAPELLLLLDYDGTLVPFANTPELASPDAELLDLLERLARRPHTQVHIVSGRTRETLTRWVGHLPVGLHAEHGFWSRVLPVPGGRDAAGPDSSRDGHLIDDEGWTSVRDPASEWKLKVRPLLESFAGRTPGSLVEEKTASLAWHYRMADPEFGALQAKELRLHLHQVLSNIPVQVLLGNKVIEIRHHGVDKGRIAARLLAEPTAGQLVVALGDDVTDEDMFAGLPPGGIAIHIGPSPSAAPYRLADPRAARAFLRSLAG